MAFRVQVLGYKAWFFNSDTQRLKELCLAFSFLLSLGLICTQHSIASVRIGVDSVLPCPQSGTKGQWSTTLVVKLWFRWNVSVPASVEVWTSDLF